MVSTHRSRYNRLAIAMAIFVFALLILPGNSQLTPATAAPITEASAQPTTTPTPRPILLTDPVPDPRQAGVQYFSQTGHTLRGAFLDYWQRYGGVAQFGYPLTEEFFEPVGPDNKLYQVQYFERNRFEYHPEYKGTQYEVLLGTLGRDFRQQDPPAAPLPAPAVYFQETGHNLSGVFKQYWEATGGLFVNGFPITEPAMERSTDGKEYMVQWFERSRFEWHPENKGSQYEVLLGVLGRQLSEKKGYPFGWYPLFGHAPDFSWVAGRYIMDPRFCPNCGCGNIQYTHHTVVRLWDLAKGIRIRPYGRLWEDAVAQRWEPGMVVHGRLLVLFGYPDDSVAAEPERTETCEKPAYFVEHIQTNPPR